MRSRLVSFAFCFALVLLQAGFSLACRATVNWIDPTRNLEIPGAEIRYFPVAGQDETEWRSLSVIAAENAGGPENSLAWMTYSTRLGWECREGVITYIEPVTTVVVYLPRPLGLPFLEIGRWNSYFRQLVEHEAGHVEIVFDHDLDYQGIVGSSCADAPAKADKISAFIGSLNRAYDGGNG